MYSKHISQTPNSVKSVLPSSEIPEEKDEKKEEVIEKTTPLFEIFGLKLYFDDILILCLLLFLYTENVEDINLYIALVLLLLS